jgi:hypothetical protein
VRSEKPPKRSPIVYVAHLCGSIQQAQKHSNNSAKSAKLVTLQSPIVYVTHLCGSIQQAQKHSNNSAKSAKLVTLQSPIDVTNLCVIVEHPTSEAVAVTV